MDIYFCDDCGARVTDLDLRAGKGMRKRQDTICAGCVDQGLAGAWLARSGHAAPAAMAAGAHSAAGSASLAVAEPPDRIALARDRAQTVPDDPFAVDEPAPQKPLPKPTQETDAIPVEASRRQAQAEPAPPVDSLAAAGGGFGALVGSSMPAPLVDDADDLNKDVEVADAPPVAEPDSPFDYVQPQDNDNPGKAETSEVEAVDRREPPQAEHAAKPGRTASGRQQAQKRGSTTTSKRNNVKPPSTRRSSARMQSNRVILLSLVSCGLMMIVFFGFVLPQVNKNSGKKTAPEQITEEPLRVLKDAVDEAKLTASKALQSDDPAVVKTAIAAQETMMQAFYAFQKAADKRGWTEENYGEQLRLVGFTDARSMGVSVRHRLGLLDQRK